MFRTTTSAYPKWGNWGFPWPEGRLQPYSKSFWPVRKMNVMAEHLFGSSFGEAITVVDGFEATLSRPDHTEVQKHPMDSDFWRNHYVGGHMVHYDPEVVLLQNQALFHLLQEMCVQNN